MYNIWAIVTELSAWSFTWLVPGPFWMWILGIGGLLSLAVFLTTVDYKPPPYEWVRQMCTANNNSMRLLTDP